MSDFQTQRNQRDPSSGLHLTALCLLRFLTVRRRCRLSQALAGCSVPTLVSICELSNRLRRLSHAPVVTALVTGRDGIQTTSG